MPPLFPSGVLDSLRDLNADNLPDSCTVQLPGEFTDDEEGGGTYSSGEEVTFACRVSPMDARQQEALVSDQLREPGLELLVFAVGQAFPVTATLVVTSGETSESQAYEVKAVVSDPTFVMLRRAVIKRLPSDEEEGS